MPSHPTIPDFHACRCDHLAAVSVNGADAAGFLHGQVSNDIEHLGELETALAAYCNPKGRMIALARVIRTGSESFVLLMSSELVEAATRRLRMYVLRAKASLEPTGQRIIGLSSREAASRIVDTPPEHGKALGVDDGLLVNVGVSVDRYLLITDGDAPRNLKIDERPDLWLSVLARDAVPEVFGGTTESFLPQAVNLDLLDAVNFRKGCYPGQEIVARLRYLGKLKQRMIPVVFEGGKRDPGEAITSGGGKIGDLVLCGPSSTDGTWLGLAAVTFGKLDQPSIEFEDGTAVTVLDPPYEIPELQDSTELQP